MKKNFNVLILSLVPALFILTFIWKCGVNVPYWDEWEFPTLIDAWFSGALSFSDLVAQHNEHRIFFPRILTLMIASIAGWNLKIQMVLSFLTVVVSSFNIWYISKRTTGLAARENLLFFLVANLLLFSPIHYENWLWAINIACLLPVMCLTSCISISLLSVHYGIRYLACAALCVIATFSLASGLFLWFIVLPGLLLADSEVKRWKDLKKRFLPAMWWIGVFLVCVAVYFHDFQKTSHHPGLTDAFSRIHHAILYLLALAGSSLGAGNLVASIIAGTGVTALFVVVVFRLLRKNIVDPSRLRSQIPWLTLAAYNIVTALVIMTGRVGFGIDQALDSRYAIISAYLIVSLLYLLVLYLRDEGAPLFMMSHARLKRITLIGFVIFSLGTYGFGLYKMSRWHEEKLAARACLAFVEVTDMDAWAKRKIYAHTDKVMEGARLIDEMGFLNPPLIDDDDLMAMIPNGEPDPSRGCFESLVKINDEELQARGWAILPEADRRADVVFLTCKSPTIQPNLFKVAYKRKKRSDLFKSAFEMKYKHSGWILTIPAKEIPSGEVTLNAWGYDLFEKRAFKLGGEFVLHDGRPKAESN